LEKHFVGKIIMNRLILKVSKKLLICLLILTPQFILAQNQAEVIATGFLQPEGPVWIDSLGVLFSDIRANKIYKWSESSGMATAYIVPSDSSNGLTLDKEGRLIICQMGKRRVVRREADGTITPLATNYNGKRFNCPNDVVVKSNGSIFFTDPDFNIPFGHDAELPFKGIYRINPTGAVQLLDSTFDKPNGICFSPDEKKLYVNESPKGMIYVWDVVDDSVITNKKLLYTIPVQGYADGMKVDPNGNIYCTGPTGVWIVSPNGDYLDKIVVPGSASNCNWGDNDRKTLYITGGNSLYKVRLNLTGIHDSKKKDQIVGFILNDNFPNPFNPSTKISYTIPLLGGCNGLSASGGGGLVTLKVYDFLGREITTLVNDEKSAGSYEVEFDGSKFSSGVYFYQLLVLALQSKDGKAEEFIQTRKMILMK
jgi:gluconolactonase